MRKVVANDRSGDAKSKIDLPRVDFPGAVSPGGKRDIIPFTVLWRHTITRYRSIFLSGRVARKKHAPPVCARTVRPAKKTA